MIRTITLGQHILVQGAYVRDLPDGRMEVRDGAQVFAGRPVETRRKAELCAA